jgi:hypothetical protein
MREALTLEGLSVPLRALRLLAVDFGHLPAPLVHVSPVDARRLELSLHDVDPGGVAAFAAFEAWRTALGITPEAVTYHVQDNGLTRVLRAAGVFAGVEVMLTAFADVSTPDPLTAGGAR